MFQGSVGNFLEVSVLFAVKMCDLWSFDIISNFGWGGRGVGKHTTLPKTNIAPENGWLQD